MKIEDVKVIGVLGAGAVGHGIAQVCARSGFNVLLFSRSEETLRKALYLIRSGAFGLDKLVEKGRLTVEEADAVMSRIKTTTSMRDFGDVDFVIEAVPEDVEVKKKAFSELDEICKEDVVFASNTSAIMISDLASSVKRKDKLIGMHWFNPAPVMKLIEVVRGVLTSDETFKLTVELVKKLGKTPIEAKDSPGFFTTRFMMCWFMEAIRLLEAGVAGVREIDEMCKLAFGFPMGPFELMDFTGLHTALQVSEYIYRETREKRYAPPVTLKKLVISGYTGDPKFNPGSRGGWYEYFGVKREEKR
ncbi:MAG: 3-hydroxyacyl-CoA dehydrogenase NAD-binding domain-containing protein [Candidatus Jordarchaeales archaeon]|nr:3-hydroxyacyl-CoA dehydrogenase [Candidatus Jordarchaeia archaeon]